MRLASTGTNNGANKLTSDDVRQIRKEREAGVPRTKLAERYGVGFWTIRDIDYGHTWSWLD
jgi:hypothetical protein